MGKYAPQSKRGTCLDPTDIILLRKPLEFIHEDHLREREICVMLDAIAQGQGTRRMHDTVIGFLTNELPLHLKDEEEDLFPLLKRRCEPEDDIGRVIAKLTSEHDHAEHDTPNILALLDLMTVENRQPDDEEQAALTNFALHARRHLILENAVILPIARLRLTPTDLESLFIRMCQRRGVDHLGEINDAG